MDVMISVGKGTTTDVVAHFHAVINSFDETKGHIIVSLDGSGDIVEGRDITIRGSWSRSRRSRRSGGLRRSIGGWFCCSVVGRFCSRSMVRGFGWWVWRILRRAMQNTREPFEPITDVAVEAWDPGVMARVGAIVPTRLASMLPRRNWRAVVILGGQILVDFGKYSWPKVEVNNRCVGSRNNRNNGKSSKGENTHFCKARAMESTEGS